MFIKQLSISFLIFNMFILINQFINPLESYASNINNWVSVRPSKNGEQSYDIDSITKINEHKITLFSKYIPKGTQEEITYKMNINCNDKLFQDISINGSSVIKPVWQNSHGDILLEELIDETCNFIKN